MRVKTGCVKSGAVICLVGDQSMDASIERRRRFGDRTEKSSFLLARGFAQHVRDERLVQSEIMCRARMYEAPEAI